jgi:hypothetical protein
MCNLCHSALQEPEKNNPALGRGFVMSPGIVGLTLMGDGFSTLSSLKKLNKVTFYETAGRKT